MLPQCLLLLMVSFVCQQLWIIAVKHMATAAAGLGEVLHHLILPARSTAIPDRILDGPAVRPAFGHCAYAAQAA